MRLQLADIARWADSASAASGEVCSYSIDTRTLAPGDLFIAIEGENQDGHDFVSEAAARGAAAAVVSRDIAGAGNLIRVDNTLGALQKVASRGRELWGGKVIGVTGSAGKTTTKDVIAAILESAMPVGKTVGNLNNHIGLPLSILRLPAEARAAVLELGMNHAGEIAALAAIARPDIAVVTNVGYAHIEAFDSVDGIALAKRELVESLSPEGTAVLNSDDDRVRDFAAVHKGRTVTFGLGPGATVRADDVRLTPDGSTFRVDGVLLETPLAGRHGVRNVLAGLAVAGLFGIGPGDASEAIRTLKPGKMRGERSVHRGITVINDCYNSNPDAVQGMLDVLRDIPAERHIAVLGEMLELGRWSEPLHRDVGRYAAGQKDTVLVGIRGAARHMVEGAIEAGLPRDAAYFFPDPSEAGAFLRDFAREGDAILFKGSRGTHVEKAVERFVE